MTNRPVISTAKVRGLIKKNKISYVDAIGRLYPSIHSGLSVWQLCDKVYVRAFGKNCETYAATLKNALGEYGLTLHRHYDRADTFTIVQVGA